MVGAAGDGAGEDGEGVVPEAAGGGECGGDADTDGGGGAAVKAEDDAGAIVPAHRWHLALEVPRLPIPVPLHLHYLLSLSLTSRFSCDRRQ